jgi:hypothetical protein
MRVEVLGGFERRRWSQDDKARIVEETLAPGAKVTEVARRTFSESRRTHVYRASPYDTISRRWSGSSGKGHWTVPELSSEGALR